MSPLQSDHVSSNLILGNTLLEILPKLQRSAYHSACCGPWILNYQNHLKIFLFPPVYVVYARLEHDNDCGANVYRLPSFETFTQSWKRDVGLDHTCTTFVVFKNGMFWQFCAMESSATYRQILACTTPISKALKMKDAVSLPFVNPTFELKDVLDDDDCGKLLMHAVL